MKHIETNKIISKVNGSMIAVSNVDFAKAINKFLDASMRIELPLSCQDRTKIIRWRSGEFSPKGDYLLAYAKLSQVK